MPDIHRRDFLGALAALPLAGRLRPRRIIPLPSPSQLVWQRDELALFLHFGVNTFSNREWGDGREDPASFNPTALDAREWARVARRAGFKAMILTAKHHDGFCLWPTATTRHSVASSPWRGGQGDLVREFTDACRAEGLRAGLYLSPWDRNATVYGDSPAYDAFYLEQLTELLTRYGPIHEVWFDGANGEGPNGRRQVYDWDRYWGTVRRLQPDAVMFSDAGPDVRWIGNERGVAGETNWSTVDPTIVTRPGMTGDEVMRSLTEGDRRGTVWRPGETDTSIRPGWFWHPEEDDRVRSVDDLEQLFFTSVGRNSKLLLNVPPTRDGVIHPTDAARLMGMRERLERRFGSRHRSREEGWLRHPNGVVETVVEFAGPVEVGVIDVREQIERGQCVAAHRIEALTGDGWHEVARGTTIGYRRLHAVAPIRTTSLRVLVTEAVADPWVVTLEAHPPG